MDGSGPVYSSNSLQELEASLPTLSGLCVCGCMSVSHSVLCLCLCLCLYVFVYVYVGACPHVSVSVSVRVTAFFGVISISLVYCTSLESEITLSNLLFHGWPRKVPAVVLNVIKHTNQLREQARKFSHDEELHVHVCKV